MNKVVNEPVPAWFNYFFFMGKDEIEVVKSWLASPVKAKTQNQRDFLFRVRTALHYINYEYYISTIEPSLDDNGFIMFKPGNEVATDFDFVEWELYAKAFYQGLLLSEKVMTPSRDAYYGWKSELANIYELFLWYAWRIAKGYWTLEEVCDDSSALGNYLNSPKVTFDMQVSGEREVAGFRDGIGNTRKWVAALDKMHSWVCGGSIIDNGLLNPVAYSRHVKWYSDYFNNKNIRGETTGVIVLKPGIVRL